MKKIILVGCTLLFSLFIVSCSDNAETNNNFTSEAKQTDNMEAINSTDTSNSDKDVENSLSSDVSTEEETMDESNDPTDNSEDDEMVKDYTLIVIGKDITQGNYVYFNEDPGYAELPFTAVMKGLGAVVEQKSENTTEIIINGETYILDTSAVSLVKAGSSTNYIIPAPGSKVYYRVVEGEFMIDHITLKTITMMMGIDLGIDVNYQQYSVVINYQ